MKKDFYFGCPNCPEPKTTLRDGEHVFIYTTPADYGLHSKVVIKCMSCESVQDITNKVIQTSYAEIQKMLDK